VDSLLHCLPAALRSDFGKRVGAGPSAVIVTLHRPTNVDDPVRFAAIAAALREIAQDRPVIFPTHPRTVERLANSGVNMGSVQMLPPAAYLDMINLLSGAHAVITDSGGIQEETTVLGVPCLTLRQNTERPITLSQGTNQLVPDPTRLASIVRGLRRPAERPRPEGWDGRAGERAVQALLRPRPGSSGGRRISA
jgi:UDP-N-acetylglucosamine 2-epimerase (non-hydrolysing)